MKRIIAFFSLAVLSLGISGCNRINDGTTLQGGTVAPQPQVEGQWVDPRGVVSSFSRGIFETRTSDTHEKLAEGNYVKKSPQLIEIEMRSLVRGTVSRVNCALGSGGSQLLCTAQDGSHFSLARKTNNNTPTYVNTAR